MRFISIFFHLSFITSILSWTVHVPAPNRNKSAMAVDKKSKTFRRSPRRRQEIPEEDEHDHVHHETETLELVKPVILSKKRQSKPCTDCDCNHDTTGKEAKMSPRTANTDLVKTTTPLGPKGGSQSGTDPDQIVFVNKAADLNKIQDDAVQLAVWRQTKVPSFVTALSDPSIAPEDLPAFEGMVLPGNMVANYMKERMWVPYKLRSHEKRKQALDEEGIDELVQHIEDLVQVFADISKEAGVSFEEEVVNVKLHVVEDNKCKYWHQDCVPFRMIATFRGACTEWVPPEYKQETLKRRQFDSEHMQSLKHCDVALFKGRDDVDDDVNFDTPGIVHRSPQIEGKGSCRLVLVIDIPQEGMHF